MIKPLAPHSRDGVLTLPKRRTVSFRSDESAQLAYEDANQLLDTGDADTAIAIYTRLVDSGFESVSVDLGLAYIVCPTHIPNRFDQAYKWLAFALNIDSDLSAEELSGVRIAYAVSLMHLSENPDIEQALYSLGEWDREGDLVCTTALGLLLSEGEIVNRNDFRAESLLSKAYDARFAAAGLELARIKKRSGHWMQFGRLHWAASRLAGKLAIEDPDDMRLIFVPVPSRLTKWTRHAIGQAEH